MSVPRNLAAAAKSTADCLGVGTPDTVLVLCNRDQWVIADLLAAVTKSRAAAVRLLEYPALSRNYQELPDDVAHPTAEPRIPR